MNTQLRRLCLAYLALATLWVLLGEVLLHSFDQASQPISMLEVGKGMAFVIFSTLLMYALGRHYLVRLDRHQQEQRIIRGSLRQAEAVFASTQEGVLISDAQQHILYVNPAFSRITGYSLEEVVGQTPKLFASGQHDASFYGQMWQDLQDKGMWSGEIWNRRKSGEVYSQWQNLRTICDEHNKVTHYVAVFSDLSALKRSQEELDYLAHYDPLVALPNRLLFSEACQARSGTSQNG